MRSGKGAQVLMELEKERMKNKEKRKRRKPKRTEENTSSWWSFEVLGLFWLRLHFTWVMPVFSGSTQIVGSLVRLMSDRHWVRKFWLGGPQSMPVLALSVHRYFLVPDALWGLVISGSSPCFHTCSPSTGAPLPCRKSQRKGKMSPTVVKLTAVNSQICCCWESEAPRDLFSVKVILCIVRFIKMSNVNKRAVSLSFTVDSWF